MRVLTAADACACVRTNSTVLRPSDACGGAPDGGYADVGTRPGLVRVYVAMQCES